MGDPLVPAGRGPGRGRSGDSVRGEGPPRYGHRKYISSLVGGGLKTKRHFLTRWYRGRACRWHASLGVVPRYATTPPLGPLGRPLEPTFRRAATATVAPPHDARRTTHDARHTTPAARRRKAPPRRPAAPPPATRRRKAPPRRPAAPPPRRPAAPPPRRPAAPPPRPPARPPARPGRRFHGRSTGLGPGGRGVGATGPGGLANTGRASKRPRRGPVA